jgi:murein DD-endopeptidase MepM/ murein hydrolase activator NlpD
VQSSPAVANGVIYVGSNDYSVYALNATTGAKLWSYPTGLFADSSPAVANGVVYVGSEDNNVYALDASTGAKLWSYATSSFPLSSPAVANGVVYVGSGNIIYALNAITGTKLWSFTSEYPLYSPVVANGVVYLSDDNDVYAFSTPFHQAPTLTFPLRGMVAGENQNLTPQTAQINTVFDHTMLEEGGHFSVYGCDKQVEDFVGEVGNTKPSKFYIGCRRGYQNVTNGFEFLQGVANYSPSDPINLYYDGHPGFDFQSGYGNQVYAAASGTVSYPTWSQLNSEGIWVGGNPDKFNVMELDPGNGYKMFYLHLSTHTRNIATGPLKSSLTGQNFIATKTGPTAKLQPGTLPAQSPLYISGQVTFSGQPLPGVQVNLNGNVAVGAKGACTESMNTDSNGNYMFAGLKSGYNYNLYISPTKGFTFATQNPSALVPDGTLVSAGELIARSGDAGPCTASHLHFEVQQKTSKAVTMYPAGSKQAMLVNYVPVDPYGWSPSDQSMKDPYKLIPELQGAGVTNLYLWEVGP